MTNESNKTPFLGKLRTIYASRLELAIAVSLGCLNLILFAILSEVFSDVNSAFFAVGLTALYLLEITIFDYRRTSGSHVLHRRDIYDLLEEDSSIVFRDSLSPILATDSRGTVLWYNDAMRNLFPDDSNLIGCNVSLIFNEADSEQMYQGQPIMVSGRTFTAEGFTISKLGDGLFITMLTDVTDLKESRKNYEDERPVIAYLAIDNVEDVLQYTHERFRDAVAQVDKKLKDWAASINAILKSYETDKYIMFFDSKYLKEFIENRFAILDIFRETRVGDEVSLTVSMGIAKTSGSLAQREAIAREAIDMALQRGGDQVVYREDFKTEYFGGRTKSVYKRSNVRSRTFTAIFYSLLGRADNVIIMGHRYGDFDSFGSSVGVVKLCENCGVKANIAIDLRDKNLEPCINLLKATQEYEDVFVDNVDALDLIGPDTVVILVDHSSISRAQFTNIANKVSTVVVIDHHRTTEKLADVIKLSYIEPSASSTCELVTEMLENAISSQDLLKEVADMLLAGVLLDTKQFTRNTGTRTFSVAQYLRGAGASPSDVYDMFKTPADELSKEARFHTAITTYRGNIAISCCDGDTDASFRVIASKAADKMLTLSGIDAAFTLVRISEQIHISGRSNGTVNVQLILEKMRGGGHFDSAGAQVISDSVEAVMNTLKNKIDEYYEIDLAGAEK